MYEKNIWTDQKTWSDFKNIRGYFFVAEAVKISMRHQYKPMHITKDIYPCLATKYKSTPTNIEHDIRTLINVCWEGNKKFSG